MVDLPSVEVKRVLVVRLDDGDDIIPAVRRIAVEQQIKSAFFYALGAISKVVYSVYSPDKNAYANFEGSSRSLHA
jgi:predicted DNA-binding protein with PD1-like motif